MAGSRVARIEIFTLSCLFQHSIANEQIVFNFTENGGQPNYDPDGMTIDNEGNVYVGTFGGSKIVMVNPR